MAYEPAHIDAALIAAIGDDATLMRDLRHAFQTSAQDHLRALTVAVSVPEWHIAAWRFKGLCATFALDELVDLAAEATACPAPDREMLHRIEKAVEAVIGNG